MKDELIIVTPFQFIDYMEVGGQQSIGKHGTFRIVGHISPEREQEYFNLIMSEIWVHVDAVTYDGSVKRLFRGLILNADIEKIGETCVLTLELITGSYLMDMIKHIRSFQDADISYDSVLDTITEQYANREYKMTVGKEDVISDLLLQYNETDWEFAGRIASHFGSYVYPDTVYEGTKIYLGEPEIRISTKVNMNEYIVERRDSETYSYIVNLRELFYLGDWLEFNGKLVWISEVITNLVGNELYHTYRLTQKNGIKVQKKYNERCVGAALIGNVTAVEKDKVQIELEKDENKERSGKRWFMYATPYSTPDGTGWYCMPEIGDCIRLRIPSNHEAEAYVINSVHLNSTDESERQNPDNKSIMNKQGKEILFTPHSLILTNNAGMSIEISDEEGIRITSDKDININAAENIEIISMASKLELCAQKNITLKQGNITMNMDGEMRMQGARLNLN